MDTLIINGPLSFADLAARLRDEGWQRVADPTAPSPLIEGEPEIAEFERTGVRLHCHFDPATGLRQLRASGPHGDAALAALASRLPSQGAAQARALLRAPDAASRLLGLRMAEALGDPALLGDATQCMDDANATVARQAARTCMRLIAQPGLAALGTVGQWKAVHPDKSAIFLLAGSTANKLQILRWLAHDRRQSNAPIEAVLRTALEDPDWEVRVTAVVVAARLRAGSLAGEVARTRLPEDTADGVNLDERRMLRTLQLCALELLEGVDVPPLSPAPPTTRAAMHDHLLRCLAGEPVLHHEKVFLFITSLGTPLPDEVPPPGELPPGISSEDGGHVLDGAGIALCWVPPIGHWLGETLPRMQVDNPIRWQSGSGFFISSGLVAAPGGADTLVCDHAGALAHCRQLAAATGLAVRLPTADEWEMAVRGPDARRFPWGNNAGGEGRFGPSPWGVREAVGRFAQWTSTAAPTDGADDMLVCGGDRQWVCAMRALAHRGAAQAFRVVIGL